MNQNLSSASPPAYGSVANQPNQAPPPPHPGPDNALPPVAFPAGSAAQSPGQGNFPQPGQYPGGPPPDYPPPKYEPRKDQPMPQQPMPGGQYPPAGYQTQYAQPYPQQTVVVAQDMGWSAVPKTTQCPQCRAFVTTATESKAGGFTWLACGLICLFGCWAGCCLIPFCLPELQDVEHSCPNCNYVMGVFHRM